MKIRFDNVLPKPLANEQHAKQSVWSNNFELNQGHFYLLNASSGKGKSTFSSILYGLRHDYTGSILFNDQSISEFSLVDWSNFRQTKISAVFQSLDLFPNLSVIDNLLIKNRLTDFKTEQDIVNCLETLGIETLKNKLVGNLSMGQQQRVAIVRSLCQPFKWLLLDEPFSHLDLKNIENAIAIINEAIENQQAGTILTTLGSDYNIKNYNTLFL
ncbi:MAG: ATP-binding cassette domain-containing protein [Crocinitomicaceae bacterium]